MRKGRGGVVEVRSVDFTGVTAVFGCSEGSVGTGTRDGDEGATGQIQIMEKAEAGVNGNHRISNGGFGR